MNKKTAIIISRLFFGLLALISILVQFQIHVSHEFPTLNFFSYFTNLSNALAGVILTSTALVLLKGRELSRKQEMIRGSAVAGMILVGLVFNTLLLNVDMGTLLPWINNVQHRVLPVFMLLDWIYSPPTYRMTGKQIAMWALFPLAFLIYSLIRGSLTGWYPYFFFNPQVAGGAIGVTLYCLSMLLAFVGICWGLSKIAQIKNKQAA